MSQDDKIRLACKQFILALGDNATDEIVFYELAHVAKIMGLRLSAYQRGINGTFICFDKEEQNETN